MMQSKKKVLNTALAAALSLAVAVTAAGCSGGSSGGSSSGSSSSSESSGAGSSGSSSSASSAASKLSGTITEASWNDAADAMQAEAKEFMAENPGTTVTVLSVDSNYTKLYAELAAASGVPDVVQTQNRDFMAFLNKYPDQWLDVTGLVKPEESNFVPTVLPLVSKDGKYYAVPWDVGPCAMFYRTDLFKSAGVDASAIKTWDDYIAAGKKIVASTGGKTKMIGFDYSGSTSTDITMMLLNELGGKYYSSDGKVSLASNEMEQALGLQQKMKVAGISLNLTNEWNDRITATENNQLATIPYAVWYAGTLKSSNKDQSGKWGIVPLPAFTAGGNNQANLGGSVLAISTSCKNQDLAKAFVKFSLMSSKGNQINLETGALFTSYSPSYKDAEYAATDAYFGGQSVGKEFSALTPKIPAITFGPYFTDVSNALKTGIGNVLVKGQSPKDAMTAATATAQKAVDNE